MTRSKAKRPNSGVVLGLLAVFLAASIVCSFMLGRYPVSPKALFGILASRLLPIEPFWAEQEVLVVFAIRLPRILIACLVGCSLSAAGATYQGVFQNAMAAPDLLGASSGAAFGAALAILFDRSGAQITLYAFASSLACVLLVMLVGNRARGKRAIGLILAGIMISSLFSAGTSFVKLVADTASQLPVITYWLMGSLSGIRQSDVVFALIPMALGFAPLLLLRWRLNVLTLGDDEARTLGVNARSVRIVAILSATLMTAASVAVSGMIGWVGLVVPHMARHLVGNDYRKLLPASMLLGALFLLLVDDACRNLLATEIPIGVLTAFIGAPFFLWLILGRGETV